MQHLVSHRRGRRHLLAGSALALASFAASIPVQAQIGSVVVTGSRTLVSRQSNVNADGLATGDGSAILLDTGPVSGSTATLSDNGLRATTRGNQADQSLVLDASGLAGPDLAHLEVGADSATANGDVLIASIQSNHGSMSDADLIESRVALDAGDITGSSAAVLRTTQEAVAMGNDATSSLTLTGATLDSGAGILTLQSTDGSLETSDDSSPVGAHFYGQTALSAGSVSQSDLAISDTLGRAVAYGNATTSTLSVQAGGMTAPAAGDTASQVSAGQSGAVADAGFALLSNQYLGASIKARAGNPMSGSAAAAMTVESVDTASLAEDGNGLVGAGYGNQSANSLVMTAASIGAAAPETGNGAVAAITAVQRLGDDGRVTASTYGAPAITVSGDVADASLSASTNVIRAVATANRANGNLLTVSADTIDTLGGSSDGAQGRAAFVSNARIDGGLCFKYLKYMCI